MSKKPTEYPGISYEGSDIWYYYVHGTLMGSVWLDKERQVYHSHSNRTQTTQTHPTFEAAYIALRIRA